MSKHLVVHKDGSWTWHGSWATANANASEGDAIFEVWFD